MKMLLKRKLLILMKLNNETKVMSMKGEYL